MAKKHDVYIVAGANCPVPDNPERGYTSQILVGPDGSVGRYSGRNRPAMILYRFILS